MRGEKEKKLNRKYFIIDDTGALSSSDLSSDYNQRTFKSQEYKRQISKKGNGLTHKFLCK